jgi:hypothetical protein
VESPTTYRISSVREVRPVLARMWRTWLLLRPTDRLRFFKPVWSPDGRKLLLGCHDVAANLNKLCTVDAAGRNVRVIVDATPVPVNFPAWGSHPGDR